MSASDEFVITSIDSWEQFSRQRPWPQAPRYRANGSDERQEHDRLPDGVTVVTKAVWDALPWNPMIGHSFHDPEAGPKPAWEEVVNAFKAFQIESQLPTVPGAYANLLIGRHRDATAHESHEINDAPIHA